MHPGLWLIGTLVAFAETEYALGHCRCVRVDNLPGCERERFGMGLRYKLSSLSLAGPTAAQSGAAC